MFVNNRSWVSAVGSDDVIIAAAGTREADADEGISDGGRRGQREQGTGDAEEFPEDLEFPCVHGLHGK